MKKYSLITGASSGIGRQIAIQLSKKNNVILSGSKSHKLKKTKSLCSRLNKNLIWEYDFKNIENLQSEFENFLKKEKIFVDNFIHCAGIAEVKLFRLFNLSEINKTFNINFLSASIIAQSLVKKTNKKKLKNILFISSLASEIGVNGHSFYCASKGAIDSLMKSLAIELAPNTRVNSILPGTIKTEMNKSIFKNKILREKIQEGYLLGPGEIQYIVDYVLFIISEKAKWITGQKLIIDGGKSSHG